VTTKVSPAYTSSAKSVRIVLGIEGNAGLVEHYRSALRSGDTVQLSLDTTLQDAAVRSLRRAVASTPGATNGSFVAMNPQNGEVYAIGSLLPQVTNSGPIAPNTFADRATQIAGPIGSTFSPIAALAALQSGRWTASQTYDDTGRYVDGSGDVRQNAGGAAYGVIDTTRAIAVSSDDFFYNLGARLSSAQPSGGPLQEWARALGIGQRTGIDAGPENEGILPSPAWWAGRNNLERQCEQGTGPFAGKPRRSSCGIADGRPWSVDDDENLAVGQGDLEATPLQVAVAYSAIENDGNVVQPHVGRQIADPSGTAVHTISPPARRTLRLDPTDRAAVLTGLRDASSIPGGTAADVFGNFPEPVYGKTGTAQLAGRANQAWYAGFVPSSESKRPIVVVVSVDGGGFGAATAAPVARQIFSQWFFGKPGPYRRGRSHTL
jgi:penicillin-binding protein 2